MPTQEELLAEFEDYARKAAEAKTLMRHMSDRLHHEKARYNWVGFYLMEAPANNTLVLGPYVGSFVGTPRIPLDQGLCGAAATQRKTVVVNDVPHDLRYLGSDIVKSNIVVPIFVDKKVMAELCIESYFAGAFPAVEQSFIESCAAVVERFLKKKPDDASAT
jgi:L-methionine (R)-S-oxide reductase